MTNEEAIRRIKARFDKWALDDEDMKAIQTFIPELCENKDEKIREFLIGILSQGTWRKEWPFSPNEVVAYLERQNHVQSDTEKEYVKTLKSLIFNFLRGKDEVDRDYYQRIEDWLDGRHVEQKEQESTNVLEDAFKYYTDRGITISCGDFKAEPKKEQKSEWSEEDEGELQNAIDALEFLGKKGVYKSESGYDAALQAASWLKSLPERFSLQPKQEWSEEDKKMLWIIQLALTKHPITDKQEKEAFDWLNSLRPQPHTVSIKDATKFGNLEYERGVKDGIQSEKSRQWKPTEEQIYSLGTVVKGIGNISVGSVGYNLKALYEQLKKLI